MLWPGPDKPAAVGTYVQFGAVGGQVGPHLVEADPGTQGADRGHIVSCYFIATSAASKVWHPFAWEHMVRCDLCVAGRVQGLWSRGRVSNRPPLRQQPEDLLPVRRPREIAGYVGQARLVEPVQGVIIGGHSWAGVGVQDVWGICMVFLGASTYCPGIDGRDNRSGPLATP